MKVEKKLFEGAVCNLCSSKFRRKSVFVRYCDTCRKKSELYRFADSWAVCASQYDGDEGDSYGFPDIGEIA